MKKVLIGFLVLAAAGTIFAQEQGLQLGGSLKTGLRFDAAQDVEYNNRVKNLQPSIGVYHDDAGSLRFDLEGSYTKDNYGVVFRLRFNPQYEGGDIGINTTDLFHQGYVWADVFNKLINFKAGKIDDPVWKTAGDEGFRYDKGIGLRFEVKPIEGLNFGVLFNTTNQTYTGAWRLASDNGLSEAAQSFMLETGFGVKYEHRLFDIAGGFRLDGKGDGLDTKQFYKWSTYNFSSSDDRDKGFGLYGGLNIKAVDNLTAAVEAQFNNLGKFNNYGWVWINEVIKYQVTDALNLGIVMHQFLFGEDNLFTPVNAVAPLFKFNPQVSYDLNDKWNVGLEIPLEFWPEVVTSNIGIKPKVKHKLGENAAIAGYYQLGVLQYDKNTGFGKNGETPDYLIGHTVQINFEWSF